MAMSLAKKALSIVVGLAGLGVAARAETVKITNFSTAPWTLSAPKVDRTLALTTWNIPLPGGTQWVRTNVFDSGKAMNYKIEAGTTVHIAYETDEDTAASEGTQAFLLTDQHGQRLSTSSGAAAVADDHDLRVVIAPNIAGKDGGAGLRFITFRTDGACAGAGEMIGEKLFAITQNAVKAKDGKAGGAAAAAKK